MGIVSVILLSPLLCPFSEEILQLPLMTVTQSQYKHNKPRGCIDTEKQETSMNHREALASDK